MKQFDITTDAEQLVADVFTGLHSGGGRSSIPGGQTAANLALSNLQLRGYAKDRSEVLPIDSRGATVMSPYVRHNIISLSTLWDVAEKHRSMTEISIEMSCYGRSTPGTSTHASARSCLAI